MEKEASGIGSANEPVQVDAKKLAKALRILHAANSDLMKKLVAKAPLN